MIFKGMNIALIILILLLVWSFLKKKLKTGMKLRGKN
jgi:hypothetical protein